ncbi:tetratricopeptide repeat protein [Shimia biformata]|uniref:tetratricopeptide repeat protein n=1 Tax=Shimia biformata TaxID=1294299 RepID=UPI0019526733|nr:tetratricopeptide repeat protein [Shimia biformata]
MIAKKALSIVAIAALAGPVFAAGGDGGDAPAPTTGTKTCLFGKVWDADAGKCVKPDKSSLSLDQKIDAVRELAYAGKYEHAQVILSSIKDQTDDRVMTYWGFTTRKMGDVDAGMRYYNKALATNPDNLLVRSYMGQALVEMGRLDLAQTQLLEIRMRGGAGSWPEVSLAEAIRTGRTHNY